MKCEHCGDPLPALSRRNRRYCDARCRRRAFEERRANPIVGRSGPAEPELAPVIQIVDDRAAEELLARVIAEPRLVGLVAVAAKTNWRAAVLAGAALPGAVGCGAALGEEPVPVALDTNDPFREVDALAAKRRARQLLPD